MTLRHYPAGFERPVRKPSRLVHRAVRNVQRSEVGAFGRWTSWRERSGEYEKDAK